MNNKSALLLAFLLLLPITFSNSHAKEPTPLESTRTVGRSESKTLTEPSFNGKKVLTINSYHKGYTWSDGIEAGILKIFKKFPEIECKFYRLDSKRNTSESYLREAALNAKKLIETWKPDVVIASDDNASKYVIVPYYKNVELPIVFCGVNWNVAPYGYPYKNVTGMIEVALMDDLVRTLRTYSKGNRIGFLGPAVTSARQDASYYKGIMGIEFTQETYVKTFDEWKSAYLQMQQKVDILIVPALEGTKNWDPKEASDFIQAHTEIPSGAEVELMAKYVLATFAKDPAEQGEWAATTALEILKGKKPEDIPIVTNRKAKIILNMKLAKKLDIKFPMELLERATFVGEEAY